MPGTTRYSATFDRTYEEEPKPSSPPNARRSRSQSWQANSGHDGRQYTPFASRSPAPRSSSSDNNPSNGTEFIPTRTAKTSVKAHNNPFQFVKVGTCPLYKKAEEQLKKAKEIKKPDVLKEEEEEWQTNLDSWKSRRRKMSEDVIRRQEEIKLFELEEQIAQVSQKKTKTFSEMVESRATRGRALSLCLLSSPLEFQNWEFENKTHKNGSCSYTDESGENSTVNSEDEGVSVRGRHGETSNENEMNHRTNGNAHIEQNGSKDKQNGNCNKLPSTVQLKPKENSYIDSGLESISSSHRAGDTPDSGSDFSQDSNSSIDCDSPRTGVNVLEEFSSKSSQISQGHDIVVNLTLNEKGQDFGFTFLGGKNEGQVIIASILEGSKAESSGMHLGDRIITIDGCDVNSRKHIEIAALIQKCREKGQINLLLWRHAKTSERTNGLSEQKHATEITDENLNAKSYEKSIESENEMYVDDFEDLKRQSALLAKKKFDVASTNAQSANSQKVNTSAKFNEDSKISNDSLNIVFQSQTKTVCSENVNNNSKNFENNSNKPLLSADLVTDVPPVDKIAEEMEKLILEQLEEEERAKELSSGKISVESSPEHFLTAPPRLAEPPKEKPPPPPSSDGSPKESSLKRVNSTKRIKKEIYKRRSNFLGIENADESIICNEPSVPPPPALEEILKAEMELDRQSRLRIESEATKRLSLEEKEIMQKEREIIESLETEERRKMYINGLDDCNNVYVSKTANEDTIERDRIESLKCERKQLDAERQMNEEQQQILLEEKQLKEREEFIKQQEAAMSTMLLLESPLSVSENTANNFKKPALSSVPAGAQSNRLLLGANGDGNGLILNSSENSGNESSINCKKTKPSEKPAVPPKPLKKKEAIRKERERLRQEQEALQREREEHRRKLMLEQEELVKQQKTHAPDAPASRLGPHPPHVQPSFPPQLTNTMNAIPNARENASFPSRSHHGTLNGTAGSINAVELMGPPVVKQNRLPPPRKAVQNEAWGQQKMSSVRKQNHESLTENRYNQNHWLIQEAEMRRITEQKERQRIPQTPCTQTHLAEDDVCSNPPRVPVISPTHNPHLNYPVQEKVWNYGQSNMPLKYPPAVVKEPPLHTIYPRETVPQQPPTKPSRVVPSERQEQMLSVSGRKRCSHCNEELGRGAAMIIESLQLYYHIHCFQCCVCQAQLGNGSCGTDVRVRNNKLHCHNCYSNDEAGLKFSQV